MDGILLRVSCFFVADGSKTEQKAEDLLEVEPLVSLGGFLGCKVMFCAVVVTVLPIS